MGETDAVRAFLREVAETAGEFASPQVAVLAQRGRRAHRARQGLAISGSVALVIALSVVLTQVLERSRSSAPSAPSPAPPVGVSQLTGYRWNTLPPAPITARAYPASAWTGSQMLVWGGSSFDRTGMLFADGAAYTPATRSWQRLPSSPLAGRVQPANTWVDGRLVIWGGQGTGVALTDGATYTPKTGRWQRMPSAPGLSGFNARAYPANGRVIVLDTSQDGNSEAIQAAEYNPDANSWSPLPSLTRPDGRVLNYYAAVATDTQVLAWVGGGQRPWVLDLTTQRWAQARYGGTRYPSAQPIWTGSTVIVPTQTDFVCWGFTSCPIGEDARPGLAINPGSGEQTSIATGPLAAGTGDYVWTGAALLALDNRATIGNNHGPTLRLGDTAAWNPGTNHWTRLARAPIATSATGAVVWTGTEAIIWGITNNAPAPTASGIEFTSPTHSPTPSPPMAVTGRIEGKLIISPPFAKPYPTSGTIVISGPRHITLTVGKSGAFVATLPTGSYTVIGHTARYIVNGRQGDCITENRTTTVRADETTQATVTCLEK